MHTTIVKYVKEMPLVLRKNWKLLCITTQPKQTLEQAAFKLLFEILSAINVQSVARYLACLK